MGLAVVHSRPTSTLIVSDGLSELWERHSYHCSQLGVPFMAVCCQMRCSDARSVLWVLFTLMNSSTVSCSSSDHPGNLQSLQRLAVKAMSVHCSRMTMASAALIEIRVTKVIESATDLKWIVNSRNIICDTCREPRNPVPNHPSNLVINSGGLNISSPSTACLFLSSCLFPSCSDHFSCSCTLQSLICSPVQLIRRTGLKVI